MMENNVIATYCLCNFGGIEILDIEYGINDFVIYRFNFGDNAENKTHKAMIYGTNTGRLYFNTNYKQRIYLDECIRCN